MKPTDVDQFLADLDGGLVVEKLGKLLSHVAAGVVDHHKKGKIQLTIELGQISNASQVKAHGTLKFTAPTMRGEQSESQSFDTPFYVGSGGRVTLFPEDQTDMFGRQGNKTHNQKGDE